jgi:alkylation response protein AidB-like acyl-CoA dehydrogenase
MTTLTFERAGVARLHLMLTNKLADLLADPIAQARLGDRSVRQRIAQVHTDIACMRWLTERSLAEPTLHGGVGGSLSKLAWSHIEQTLADLALEMTGLEGLTGRWAENVASVRQASIAGGTTEINRNIVAEHALGLPR